MKTITIGTLASLVLASHFSFGSVSDSEVIRDRADYEDTSETITIEIEAPAQYARNVQRGVRSDAPEMFQAFGETKTARVYEHKESRGSGRSFSGMASFYAAGGMTTAHRSLPFGTRLRVCHKGCVVVTVRDRGPFIRGRVLDLSTSAAAAIGITHKVGVGHVTAEVL